MKLYKKLSGKLKKEVIEEIENLLIIKGFSTDYFIEEKEGEINIKIYGDEKNLVKIKELLKNKVQNIKIENEKNYWNEPYELLPYEFIKGVLINPAPENIIINLKPGIAFGTGRHESTKIAGILLKNINLKEKNVLDIGCGSGILSVLSKKLGAHRVTAIDNEIQAIEKTKETADFNNVEIDVLFSNLLEKIKGKYDVIIANIIPEVLKALIIQLNKVIKEESLIIFSGIYEDSYVFMKNLILKHNYTILKEEKINDWYGFLFTPRV